MSDRDNTGAFLAGFLIGGLTGAIATLLMTPQSGERTRFQIQERGIELKTQFDDLTTGAREQAEKLATQLQERRKDMLEEQRRDSTTDEASSDEKETTETPSDKGDE